MALTQTFIIFQALIVVPFVIGMLSKKHIVSPDPLSHKIVRFNLIFLEPVVVLWSIWDLTVRKEYGILPLAGFALVLAGFGLGLVLVRFIKSGEKSKASFIISSSLANHGFTMGGFVSYLLLGEKGLALTSLFLLYFMPYTFLFIFYYAERASQSSRKNRLSPGRIIFRLQNMPLFASVCALALHGAGVARPALELPIDAVMFVSIALYYFTLGLAFKGSAISLKKPEHAFLALGKFVVIPGIAFAVVSLLHLDPWVARVIVLEACMPAAIYSVISAVLFDLDSSLASEMFVVNTALFLLLILPLLVACRNVISVP